MDKHPTSHSGLKAESPLESPPFHLFSELPLELQLKIWEAAFDATSRRLSVYLYMILGFDRLSSLSGPTICITGGSFMTRGRDTDTRKESHSLSLACCDARKVYLLRYPETIILANWPSTGFSRIRCNPVYDTLYIKKIAGAFHKHDNAAIITLLNLTQVTQQVLSSFRKINSSFQHVAIRLSRDYPSAKRLKRAFKGPCPEHITIQYVTLFSFSYFESIRHFYFVVKSKESAAAVGPKHVPRKDHTEFFQGLPARGYTPARIQSFLDVYDRI
ncbi:hypothetical protein DER46DRAFT_577858 [Fusarium sp. MPI-SDFR-AT-0072]|nr:hypothetical protein DER46DRAFT_577858 [Fusarium sp. MPI-SDFR-AT-0072]